MSWWANNRTRCRKTSTTALEAFISNDKRHSGGVRKKKNMKCSREYMFICLFYCTRNKERKFESRIGTRGDYECLSFSSYITDIWKRKKKKTFFSWLFVRRRRMEWSSSSVSSWPAERTSSSRASSSWISTTGDERLFLVAVVGRWGVDEAISVGAKFVCFVDFWILGERCKSLSSWKKL